jgi:hypothetical protein
LRKYLEHNKILANEIKAHLGPRTQPTLPSDARANCDKDITDGGDVPEDEQDQEDDDIDDDTGVPLPVVVDRVLRVRVQDRTGRWLAKAGVRAKGEERLSAGDAEEDIWAYNPRGELWAKVGIPPEDSDSEDENVGSGDDYGPNEDASDDE